MGKRFDCIEEVEKFNPYHDRLGRFTSAGSAASFTIRTRAGYNQGMADRSIQRAKEKHKEEGKENKPKKYKVTLSNGKKADAYTKPPKGWKKLEGATTAPKGYTWYSNGKGLFSGYKDGLVENRWHGKA